MHNNAYVARIVVLDHELIDNDADLGVGAVLGVCAHARARRRVRWHREKTVVVIRRTPRDNRAAKGETMEVREKVDAAPVDRDVRRAEVNRRNLNRPVVELQCPRCEMIGSAYWDREWDEHPGIFTCRSCNEQFMA